MIIGYEQLLRDFDAISRCAPELVVIDEAQRIKNYATKSAAYVKALDSEYRLVLTGTPMENRLEELASILDWVDDVALAPKWRLVPEYVESEGDGAAGRTGARNLKTLRTRLATCMIRRTRREVLDQLPARTDARVPVEMTPQQRFAHDELNRPIAALASTAGRRPLTQPEFLRLMQLLAKQRMICNGLGQLEFDELWPTYKNAKPDDTLIQGLFAPKLVELRRLIADVAVVQERRVVVFSQWRSMLRLAAWSVSDVLSNAGLRSVFFTGAESLPQRSRAVVDFHDDPRVRVMFLTDAGGVGLNLQRAASSCINLELPWNPAVLEQRIGRIHRIGQRRPIDVYNLVTESSIESRIATIIGAKKALFGSVFDGTTDAVRFEASASFAARVEQLCDVDAARAPIAELRDDDDAPSDEVALAKSPDVETAPFADPAGALASLKIERTADGGLRIEAPAAAAASLSTMFEAMARLFAVVKAPR